MKFTAVLILTMIHLTTKAPASSGQLDLHTQWWTGAIGSSGNYLTEEFRKSVFIPVTQNLVKNLDKIRQRQDSLESTDNIMGLSIAVAVALNTLALVYIHKKNADK